MLTLRLPPLRLRLALLAALSLGAYLLAAALTYRLGFPLDDAWIHQTYARSLALYGQWAYWPGQPSAGSTAPLWSVLLAVGPALRLGPYVWTFLLGWATLWGIAVLGTWAFRIVCPERPAWAPWAGALLALEWHLVWAAGSGMETLLFAGLILLALGWLAAGQVCWFRLGLLVGLSAWVRPDGITLLGPSLLLLLLGGSSWPSRLRAFGRLVLGVGALFLPYLLFNRLLAGAWWPNTFFAKQAEYAAYRQVPLLQRLLSEASLPLIGVGLALLPGFVLFLIYTYRRRAWGALAGAAWLAGYIGLYSLRLPVTYQHGRYLIPAMPVFFVWGLAGMAGWLQIGSTRLFRRVFSRAWLASAALVLAGFWLLGARTYAQDVAIIESEMVDTAYWVEQHTQPGDLVAAHDIGALGYFGGRPLLDLAGLVSPEVVPFIRDEARLGAYLDRRQAAYLVTFPSWYPGLRLQGRLVYQGAARFSPAAGGENMAVYSWGAP